MARSVFLGTNHSHTACGVIDCMHTPVHDVISFQDIYTENDLDSVFAEDELAFFLNNDIYVTKTHQWPITLAGGELSLCLNGHNIYVDKGVTIFKDITGTFNICDCKAYTKATSSSAKVATPGGIFERVIETRAPRVPMINAEDELASVCFYHLNLDAELLRTELLKQRGIGTIAIDPNTLRIAFSSLDEDKIENVYSAIYEIAEKLA